MKATRDGFGESLYELVAANPNICVLAADTADSLRLGRIREEFPEQFIECGIAEGNMMSMAAGLAMAGKIPVVTSFAAFNPGRNWEQIRSSVCEANLNVKIVGSHAGLATGADGSIHQMLEDIAIMSVLPNMKVLVPADADEAVEATNAMIETEGPVYLRLSRAPTETLKQGEPLHIGRARVLRDGEDATVVACGLMVPLALQAAHELQNEADLRVGVVNMSTLKPLDEATLFRLAQKAKAVVTVEEHQKIGGLGSLVASVLARQMPAIVEMVAVEDKFGQSGTKDELWEHYGLTVKHVKDAILRALERKVEVYGD